MNYFTYLITVYVRDSVKTLEVVACDIKSAIADVEQAGYEVQSVGVK